MIQITRVDKYSPTSRINQIKYDFNLALHCLKYSIFRAVLHGKIKVEPIIFIQRYLKELMNCPNYMYLVGMQ